MYICRKHIDTAKDNTIGIAANHSIVQYVEVYHSISSSIIAYDGKSFIIPVYIIIYIIELS